MSRVLLLAGLLWLGMTVAGWPVMAQAPDSAPPPGTAAPAGGAPADAAAGGAADPDGGAAADGTADTDGGAAADLKETCVRAFGDAQRHRGQSRLLRAREELITCGQSACPDVVKVKCVEWLQELKRNIPTIVVAAAGPAGKDTIAARLLIDGTLISATLNGKPIELDPGLHTLRLEHERFGRLEEKIVVRQGEKNRLLTLRYPAGKKPDPAKPDPAKPGPAKPDPDAADPGSTPWLAIISLGLGGAGVVLGGITGTVALVMGQDLQDRCEDGICHPGDKEDLNTGESLAHVSTASITVGLVGMAVGVIALLIENEEPSQKQQQDKSTGRALVLQPLLGPHVIGLTGSF